MDAGFRHRAGLPATSAAATVRSMSSSHSLQRFLSVAVLASSSLVACARTTPPSALAPSERAAAAPVVEPSDFATSAGDWVGVLAYQDYTSGAPTTIPVRASLTISGPDSRQVGLRLAYPEEPDQDGDRDFTISDDGRQVSGLAVVERSTSADGTVRIVLEERGRDGNDDQPATFHHVLLVSPTSLVITKLVRFDGTTDFFERHAYRFTR